MTEVAAYEADSRPIDELLREVQPLDEFQRLLVAWQQALGMDQASFARHLGVGETTLSRRRSSTRRGHPSRIPVSWLEQVLERRPAAEHARWLAAYADHLRRTRGTKPGLKTPPPSQDAPRPMAAAS